MDTEAIISIITPVIEEREKAIIAMIADLRNQLEEMFAEKTEEEPVQMSASVTMSEKFSKFKQFTNQ
jgi:tagatose-1,6-bisphosphate aldolase